MPLTCTSPFKNLFGALPQTPQGKSFPLTLILQNHIHGSAVSDTETVFRGRGSAPRSCWFCFRFCPHILGTEGAFFYGRGEEKGSAYIKYGGTGTGAHRRRNGGAFLRCGLLLLKGAGMHIGKLDLEAGDVVVDGSIDSMTYSDGTLAEKHSILGRLFR